MTASTYTDRTAAAPPAQHAPAAQDAADPQQTPEAQHAEDADQVEELLVEEISIDGMCGVY